MNDSYEEFAVLKKDEDTDKLFWEINSASNKDYTRLDDGENIILNPIAFEVGTIVRIIIPHEYQ